MAKTGAQLTMRLIGLKKNDGRVRLADFRTFCDHLTACLNRLADKVIGGHAEYDITGLATGSAVMEIGPNPETFMAGAATLECFRDTVSALQDDRPVHPKLDDDDLHLFRRLGSQVGRSLDGLELGSKQITTQYVANIDKRLAKPVTAIGTLKGVLERINVHNTTEFYIYPPLADRGVPCRFPEELVELVRKALKRNVTVSGKLHYLPDSAFPQSVDAEAIEIHPRDCDLPTLIDLKGIAPDSTGGMPVLDYLRSTSE
jgi:hypothetical protein